MCMSYFLNAYLYATIISYKFYETHPDIPHLSVISNSTFEPSFD